MDFLSNEMILCIFYFLKKKYLFNCRLVCSHFRFLLDNNIFVWKFKYNLNINKNFYNTIFINFNNIIISNQIDKIFTKNDLIENMKKEKIGTYDR